jgi:hypothetical protein
VKAGFRLAVARFVAALFLIAAAAAQTPAITGLAAVPNLAQLTRSAGYIFSGTVTSVARAAPETPGQIGPTRITFRVAEAVRGVRAGQIITVNEWAGLWDAGERYHPGEQVMLFLYPPSRLGLTSAVGGAQGRFGIDSSGRIVLPPLPARITTLGPLPPSAPPITTRIFIRAIQQLGRP